MGILRVFAQIDYKDILEIVAVAWIVYSLLKLIKRTRAIQTVYGLLALAVIYFLAHRYEYHSLAFLLQNALFYLGFAIIVIFQSEIRSALIEFGKYFPHPGGIREARLTNDEPLYEEIILAATTLSSRRIGGLIIFERTMKLDNFMDTGVRLDAQISYDLLVSIFQTKAPLHDGAVIIQGDRLAAASCFLPLTLNPELSKELGTRHRAAIGITEDSDAVALVISEETGIISVAMGGAIMRHLNAARLRKILKQALQPTGRSLVARARASRLRRKQKARHPDRPTSALHTASPRVAVPSTGPGEYQDG